MKVTHFKTAAAFRRWLEKNHATAAELQVGFYRKDSGKGGMTYQESVDEALCFGWIDGVVRKIDADSFTHRFTPRKARSTWSNVNVAHVARLTAAGRMQPAGLQAYARRDPERTGTASYEKRPRKFPAASERTFRANPKAWTRWQAQPPGYQRLAIHWVTNAKLAETRHRRLAQLMTLTAQGRRLDGK